MMRFFGTDIKRAFTEPNFFISLILGIVSLFGAAAYLILNGGTDVYFSAQSLILPFAAPLLAAMPYSAMIMHERETHYRIMMDIKLCGFRYELPRFAVCGISGAAALFIPQILLLIFCMVTGQVSDAAEAVRELTLTLSFGFGYAVFSYGLTFLNRERYIPVAIPQILYLFCVYAFPYVKLERFYPPLDISPSIYGGEISADRFVIPAALTFAGIVLTAFGAARKESAL